MGAPNARSKCENCGSCDSRVLLARTLVTGEIVRRRECLGCNHKWYTRQSAEETIETWRVVWIGRDLDRVLPAGNAPKS
jgi:transcriptional regulator NrdR family protein